MSLTCRKIDVRSVDGDGLTLNYDIYAVEMTVR